MANITLSVPDELFRKMKMLQEIKWSEIARQAIEKRVERMLWKQRMLEQLEKEKEFDKEALRIGDIVKEGMWKRYKKEGW